jgi:hypothetical protein
MGVKSHGLYVDLDKALDAEDLAHAWMGAHERPGGVKLSQALRLTMLMAFKENGSYDAAVRRFLLRFIRDEKPTPEQIRKIAHALEELPAKDVHMPHEGPEFALKDLVRQLEEREQERRRLLSP